MRLKTVIWILLNLVVIFSFLAYWFVVTGPEISFNQVDNTNFKMDNVSLMQFYPNMRFPNKEISYFVSEECTLKKKTDMEKAFEIMENKTILDFYEKEDGAEIKIFCQNKQETRGNLYIAGEGGPTDIVNTEFFKIILGGEILLIRDSNCNTPNIAMHELLHVLGFNHSKNEYNIMYPVSNCKQQIGEDIIQEINNLYLYESLPDLEISNMNITTKGRYLFLNCSIGNIGLALAKNNSMAIYLDSKVIKKINLTDIDIGERLNIQLENVLLSKINYEEIKIIIESSTSELSIENNKVVLSKS